MLQRESNADETLSVNIEEKYQYQRGRIISLTNCHWIYAIYTSLPLVMQH